MREVIFNPFFDKHPRGGVETGSEVTLALHFPDFFRVWDVALLLYNDYGRVVATHEFDAEHKLAFIAPASGIYWYVIKFIDVYGEHFLVPDRSLDSQISNDISAKFQLLVTGKLPEIAWFREGGVYQILVDRFNRVGRTPRKPGGIYHAHPDDLPNWRPVKGKILNNDFFGGNLRGITAKLDYLQALGIKTLYLSPLFLSPSNHKYDCSDYLALDPQYGTEADLRELLAEGKQREIKLVFDLVFNHTGADSRYFNKHGTFPEPGAYQGEASPYFSWYRFYEFPERYECWWGIDTLPRVNSADSSYQAFVKKVLDHWFALGIGGARLDVVDELAPSCVRLINKTIKQYDPQNILIGEVWEDASNKIAYGHRRHYFAGDQLDSVMNYCFAKAIIGYLRKADTQIIRDKVRHVLNNYPEVIVNQLLNVLSTHDTYRILNQFYRIKPESRKQAAFYVPDRFEALRAARLARLAAILQYTLPGVPCLYYGDERGLDGFADPFCRKAINWNREDPELLAFYRTLGGLRKYAALRDGSYEEGKFDPGIFTFYRKKGAEVIAVAVNPTSQRRQILVEGKNLLTGEVADVHILEPLTGGVYLLDDAAKVLLI